MTGKGNPFLVPGATVATIAMLGALHARRMYSDKKVCNAHSTTLFFKSIKLWWSFLKEKLLS